MEGQILGNRYELIEKIGGGGMSLVYKAKCRLLNRYVAVKILRPEFTNDEEFVNRFRIEGQSAASLSHPNIVPIYDVGNEGNIHYIIMEYIDGITLKEYINKKGYLPWKEAVNITIQICSAIKHAHKSHIVHRDIKPHNILLTKDGIAKVTDFGIARAVTSSTITMVGSTIGSVHYFSPEQARGGYIDEKSDLYSLGIALYEMLTGKVPFDGDTPVAVALKHLQVEPQEPVEINDSIPKGLNDIVMKAIKKDPSKRYQTAPEFLQDLYTVLEEPNRRFLFEDNLEDSPTRRIKVVGEEDLMAMKEFPKKDEKGKKGNRKKDRLTYWFAGITSLIIIVIFSYIGYRVVMPSIMVEDNNFVVGNYIGKPISSVEDELTKAGINYSVKEQFDDTVPKDTIISQSMDPGKPLKKDSYSPLILTVSKGSELVTMVNLRNKDQREAEDIITTNLNLVPEIVEEFNETVAIGRVIKTDPAADEQVKPGTTVTVFISKGPEIKTTKVPNLIGKTFDEAKVLISGANLSMGKMSPEGSNYVDKIASQNPQPDAEVNEGTPVDITFDVKKETKVDLSTTINLSSPEDYGDVIKVYVEAVPSDTKTEQVIMSENKNKSDFPLTITYPVPENGKTLVRIFLDDKLYYEFEQAAQQQ